LLYVICKKAKRRDYLIGQYNIDAVPGINHDIEFMDVARLGDKQSKEIAKFLFPGIDINKYRS
jgi:hypothetical protein